MTRKDRGGAKEGERDEVREEGRFVGMVVAAAAAALLLFLEFGARGRWTTGNWTYAAILSVVVFFG